MLLGKFPNLWYSWQHLFRWRPWMYCLRNIKMFQKVGCSPSSMVIMRRSNCSDPTPPRSPSGTSLFWGGCPGLFITLFLPCLALINHLSPFIFKCPALFSLHFRVPRPFLSQTFYPGCPGVGGWMFAEKCDRRIGDSSFIRLAFEGSNVTT